MNDMMFDDFASGIIDDAAEEIEISAEELLEPVYSDIDNIADLPDDDELTSDTEEDDEDAELDAAEYIDYVI